MATTSIEWTEVTWNPTTGCDRVSPGCDHCYALTMAKRLKAMGSGKYQRDGDPRTSGPGFGVSVHEDVLSQPFSWKKPRRVFVNSMSDLFHKDVPEYFIARVFATMAMTPQHTYQVLTKRHARMRSLLRDQWWWESLITYHVEKMAEARQMSAWEFRYPLSNVWLGVSAENQRWADIRIPALLDTPAAVRFVSAEPLLGPINFERCGLPDWVIVGGESGPGARPMAPDWVRDIRNQCKAPEIGPRGTCAFFFKQWGAWGPTNQVGAGIGAPDEVCLPDSSIEPLTLPSGGTFQEGRWFKRLGKAAAGRELDGRTWDEFPEVPSA